MINSWINGGESLFHMLPQGPFLKPDGPATEGSVHHSAKTCWVAQSWFLSAVSKGKTGQGLPDRIQPYLAFLIASQWC